MSTHCIDQNKNLKLNILLLCRVSEGLKNLKFYLINCVLSSFNSTNIKFIMLQYNIGI